MVGGLNAVLQGDHERAFAGERAHCLRGVGDLPGSRLEDDVRRAQGGGIVGDVADAPASRRRRC